jgi:hypothetical protein
MKPVPDSTRVTCPKGHYLGAAVNLTTGRQHLWCPQCGAWFDWREAVVGRKTEEKKQNCIDIPPKTCS